MIRNKRINKLPALMTMAVVTVLSLGAMLIAPQVKIGSTQIGQGTAHADCGYWYMYGPDAIYTTSSACVNYFTSNGWHVYQSVCSPTYCTQTWLHRNGY